MQQMRLLFAWRTLILRVFVFPEQTLARPMLLFMRLSYDVSSLSARTLIALPLGFLGALGPIITLIMNLLARIDSPLQRPRQTVTWPVPSLCFCSQFRFMIIMPLIVLIFDDLLYIYIRFSFYSFYSENNCALFWKGNRIFLVLIFGGLVFSGQSAGSML